jgi:hypothetical protein
MSAGRGLLPEPPPELQAAEPTTMINARNVLGIFITNTLYEMEIHAYRIIAKRDELSINGFSASLHATDR